MKLLTLKPVNHSVKIGDVCGDLVPNLTEDALFLDGKTIVGFYIRSVSQAIAHQLDIANAELLSDRVPKSMMKRSSGLGDAARDVSQFSTIIGACPPKPNFKRPYPSVSSVHGVPSAQPFVAAMLELCRLGEELIREIAPDLFEEQKKIIEANSPPQFRFGRLFTSSISNFNIAAPFHRDTGNLKGCANIIFAKRWRSTGGHTTVPDYGLTVDSADNSMLVYPAWRNVHGVTPIRPTGRGGYRNSLVFYPLAAFRKYI